MIKKKPTADLDYRNTKIANHINSIHVWIVVFPGFLLLDATGPVQAFSTCNDEYSDSGGSPPYVIHMVSQHGGEIKSSSGVGVSTTPLPAIKLLSGATLVVSGGHRIELAVAEDDLVCWIGKASGIVKRCASVCNGAFLLAKAGVLTNKKACTHWKDTDSLRIQYPDIHVLDDAIYIKDGSIYSSAGVTSGIDLCLSLIEEDLGRKAALSVAKSLVVFQKRPGGQRQFSTALLSESSSSSLADQLINWLRPRIHEQIDVDRMSDAISLSSRSLHRRLQQEAGLSPAQLLSRVRMEVACKLLESGSHSIKKIAEKSGFGTEYNLRRSFAKNLGVLPTEYRERFG
ncbi:GlxA family transcriptional regulator [Solimicrobium silvestre]|uniref:Transcriptional regulator containing an amidase domain and an AraC-type DNA-binding HTH domain n=1 Tax=Solimicrobium silvestre TaxID=2099400 RepID=A0A2S9H406_9BURK|nr:helix-turn-helix domain-containing protein [Solimicrobium silvestre]PRC94712.1 Transcriptional regulator containing an amidase domain and an AraC-type DNA-binding HTH domain [Solimicrobium silvestre]